MSEDSSRRIFLRIIPSAVAGLWAFRAFAQNPPTGTPPPKPMIPPKDADGNALPGFGSGSGGGPRPSENIPPQTVGNRTHGSRGGLPDPPKADPRTLKLNETDIKRDVEKLAELAQQLKKQVEETDSTKILSLDMIKKTQEIEKLAHQIASLAKG
jgi:hypothetical protein